MSSPLSPAAAAATIRSNSASHSVALLHAADECFRMPFRIVTGSVAAIEAGVGAPLLLLSVVNGLLAPPPPPPPFPLSASCMLVAGDKSDLP